ncbi:MAG: NfeD family protein [Oscillospiraceae bacterium]|nr:NfeD family protein [Oscillospiraceae bacterium]
MNYGVIIWLSLLVVFLIAEASTVMLISLWFAAGSLAALVVCLLGGSWGLQVGVALVVSNILLLALRPLARKYFTPKLVKTNVDSVAGSQGLVTIAIDNVSAQGQVKLGAMVWTARSTSGEPITEGTLVRVDKVEGVKVFVTPVEVLEKV